LPNSQFAAGYEPPGDSFDTVVLRWKPPQLRFDVSMGGSDYQVRANTDSESVAVCMQVFGTWACQDGVPAQVDGVSVSKAIAALDPERIASAALRLADAPGATFDHKRIAGVKAACAHHGRETACVAPDTGAPLLLQSVPGIQIPGIPDGAALQATAYAPDAGL
jgi:hypothetical protein